MVRAKHTIYVLHRRILARGCPILSGVGKGWGFLLFMPRRLKRYHGRGDLHFITFSCYERRALLGTVCAQSFLEDSGAGAARLCRKHCGLRGHAGARASAVERTEKRDAGKVVASVEAARVARHARTPGTQGQRATVTGLSRVARRTATILAAEILRLQRL